MIEFYPHIKWAHIACVLASGTLFAVRGLPVQVGHDGIARRIPVRVLAHAIDTALLTIKLVLAVYVALAILAMHRVHAPRARLVFYASALITYVYVLGVARMHHPLGWIVGTFA